MWIRLRATVVNTLSPAYVALLLIHLHFPEAGSLKAKRSELNSVKAHLRQRHGASVIVFRHRRIGKLPALGKQAAQRRYTACEQRERAEP